MERGTEVKGLFDEKSGYWIKIFKVLVVITGMAMLTAGFFWALKEADGVRNPDLAVWEFFWRFAISVWASLTEWTVGMLTIRFLDHVQIIKEKLEDMSL